MEEVQIYIGMHRIINKSNYMFSFVKSWVSGTIISIKTGVFM